MKINWYEPKFGESEKRLVNQVLDEGYVNEGPMTLKLEEKFRELLNVKHVIFTNSGTSALFLALKADQRIRGLKDYEVIVPDFTCIATASAVKMSGATPVLVDIEKIRLCIDVNEIEKKITPRTKAIIPVHILGRSCDMDSIFEIANRHGLTVIEDAAGALMSRSEKGYLGTLGKVGCFSLQANKIISCGQGGMIVTNDDHYNEMIRRIKDQGRFSKDEFTYPIEGYNLKFNDVLAAILLGQLENLDGRRALLIEQRKLMEEELREVEGIKMPKVDYENGEVPLWIEIIVEDMDGLHEYLKDQEIATRKSGWPPVHRNGAYEADDEYFPKSSYISDHSLWLPNGPNISLDDIREICLKIREFYNSGIEKIYSKIDSSVLLHIVNRKSSIVNAREDMCPPEQYIQVAKMKIEKGKTFRAHKHIEQIRTTNIAQESWIVVSGLVKAYLYDLDDTLIKEVILEPGDCSITFMGGHTYESMAEDTLVYEYKTGPYQGVEKDKVFIDVKEGLQAESALQEQVESSASQSKSFSGHGNFFSGGRS